MTSTDERPGGPAGERAWRILGKWGQPHFVYRLRDAEGVVFYIGVTRDVDKRIALHLHPSFKSWCAVAVRERYASHTFEEHSDWYAAHAAEIAAIYTEAPELNRQHNGTKWRWDGRARTWVPISDQVPA